MVAAGKGKGAVKALKTSRKTQKPRQGSGSKNLPRSPTEKNRETAANNPVKTCRLADGKTERGSVESKTQEMWSDTGKELLKSNLERTRALQAGHEEGGQT